MLVLIDQSWKASAVAAGPLTKERSITKGHSWLWQAGCVMTPFLFMRVNPSSVSQSTMGCVRGSVEVIPAGDQRGWWRLKSPVMITGRLVGMFRWRTWNMMEFRVDGASL